MKLIIRKKPEPQISLKQHQNRKNKVLIQRLTGGFGDAFMVRMLFEDLHRCYPELDFYYACPPKFLPAMDNHPFVKTICFSKLNPYEYGIVFDITTPCCIHESKHCINNTLHRSDIWAKSLGVELKKHEMHFEVNCYEKTLVSQKIAKHNIHKLPVALISISSTDDNFGKSKSLTPELVYSLVQNLKMQEFFVVSIHDDKNLILSELDVLQFINITMEEWIALVDSVDLVASIDSATFHLAGGLKKPLMGIFTFVDGMIYGKYFDFVLVQKHHKNGDWECGPCYNLFACKKCDTFPKPCLTELKNTDIKKGILACKEKWNF